MSVTLRERETETGDAAYLRRVGERVREARARRGMTRKLLARDSGVSERYLAQLETGQGNISILLLRQIAQRDESVRSRNWCATSRNGRSN